MNHKNGSNGLYFNVASPPPEVEPAAVTEVRRCERHGTQYAVTLRAGQRISLLGREIARPAQEIGACPQCEQERWDDLARIACGQAQQEAQQRVKDAFDRAGVPPRLQSKSFDDYRVLCEGQENALQSAREFAERFPVHRKQGSVLIFGGSTGTGKGHLSAAIAMSVIRAGGTALIATGRELLRMLRASWKDPTAPSESEILARLGALDLLVIDELGITFGSDAERDQLLEVIDLRYRHLAPMVCTTNLSPELLQRALGDRAVSRLREGGQWVAFDWADWRAGLSG
jgi:DNA replication protein DnaC